MDEIMHSAYPDRKLWYHRSQWNIDKHQRKASTRWSLDTMIQNIFCRQANPSQEGRRVNPIHQECPAHNRKEGNGNKNSRNYTSRHQSQKRSTHQDCTYQHKYNQYSSRWRYVLNHWKKFCSHECIIMGDFNLPNIDWTLGRPTPALGSKWLQLVEDNNLTQHVHEPTRQNNVLVMVMSTEEEIMLKLEHENRRQNRWPPSSF